MQFIGEVIGLRETARLGGPGIERRALRGRGFGVQPPVKDVDRDRWRPPEKDHLAPPFAECDKRQTA